MLIEILPFLRAIASEIQSKLGYDHPGVLPTTAVAYALTSLLLGAMFLIVGALRCGSLAGFFPSPVLTGVIGEAFVGLVSNMLTVPRSCRRLYVRFRTRGYPSILTPSIEHQHRQGHPFRLFAYPLACFFTSSRRVSMRVGQSSVRL